MLVTSNAQSVKLNKNRKVLKEKGITIYERALKIVFRS